MQQWFEMISVQVGQKCLWLGMTATHVFMWEWLEDELLFNSVLIGKGVIALCFFSPSLFFFCKPAIAYRCCCRVRMEDRLWFFRGLGKKTNKAHSVCLKFTPHHFPLAFPPWGVGKNQPPLPSLVVSAALLCLHYSWLYCWPLYPCMFIGWRTIK